MVVVVAVVERKEQRSLKNVQESQAESFQILDPRIAAWQEAVYFQRISLQVPFSSHETP
jgi:hypothetical protein